MSRDGNDGLKTWGLGLLVTGLVLTAGCESGRFYGQAISGQLRLLVHREPIPEVIEKDCLPEKVREQLWLVDSLRNFAAQELGLPIEGAYTRYVALDRPYVVWNVAVSPELDLTPKSWWYPVVGRLEHRGYFRERHGKRYADRMSRRGFDVALGGVGAYSTLGWFSDPVLSTFIDLDQVNLAELLFHELAHQRLFVRGDTDFNEAFAVSVAEYGVEQWLVTHGAAEAAASYRRRLAVRQEFMLMVDQLRDELVVSYEHGEEEGWEQTRRRRAKEEVIERFRQRFAEAVLRSPGLVRFSEWVEQPINNAKISVLDTYYRLLPAFRRLLNRAENIEAYYRIVEELGDQPRDRRVAALDRLRVGGGEP